MGTFTLQDFRNEVRFDLKNRPDTGTTGLSDTRLNSHINASYLHVSHPSVFRHREVMHTYTIPLVAGTNEYVFTPTSGLAVVLAIRSVTHVAAVALTPTAQRTKLRAKDPSWFDERTINSGSRPSTYAIEGSNLLLEPVPDTSLAGQLLLVRCLREPSLLSADADVTILGSRWDEVILLGARWRSEMHLGYRDLAEATKLDYASLINEYKDFDTLHGFEEWDWQADVRTESTMESV